MELDHTPPHCQSDGAATRGVESIPRRARGSGSRVALLIGKMDDGPYAALSAALYEAMRAAGADVTFGSEATGHEFQSTEAGARRIEQVIMSDCVRRR